MQIEENEPTNLPEPLTHLQKGIKQVKQTYFTL